KKQQRLKLNYQEPLKNDPIKTYGVKTQDQTTALYISKHIVDEVLEKLSEFENSKCYLSKDIKLESLAKYYNTDSSYLSSIINHIKQHNFSTYLNYLRTNNALNSIKKQKTYLNYSIQGLAEEFGFTTAESFSKAFSEKTGIRPSFFLDELRKNNRLL